MRTPEQPDSFCEQPEPFLPPQGFGTLRSTEGQGALNLAAAQGAASGSVSVLPSGSGAGGEQMCQELQYTLGHRA